MYIPLVLPWAMWPLLKNFLVGVETLERGETEFELLPFTPLATRGIRDALQWLDVGEWWELPFKWGIGLGLWLDLSSDSYAWNYKKQFTQFLICDTCQEYLMHRIRG